MSHEENLHTAMCQAVALLNVTPEIARSETGRRAHNILREALVKYADEYLNQPVTEKAKPAAWVEVTDSYEGPYMFHGMELLPVGKHPLYLRAALAEAEKEEPVAWTNEEATAVAWQAGFAGTSWSMGPEELTHVLNTAQVPPRRELSDEELLAIADPILEGGDMIDVYRAIQSAVLRAAGGEG